MKDRFSGHASGYAAFRPTYQADLYDFIFAQVKNKGTAWDCGTGNGQVARDLAPHFKEVFATDSSVNQIKNAPAVSNIYYSVSHAEKTSFPESTFDLITVGQAIHWFNIPEFYKEVIRTAKSKAILAVWGYGLLHISPPLDEMIADFYENIIGPYWDTERKLVDDHYSTIPFPFEEFHTPEFRFSFEWTIDELEGYLTTWSSVRKFIQANDINPVESLINRIKPLWPAEKVLVNFPLFLRCGVVKK